MTFYVWLHPPSHKLAAYFGVCAYAALTSNTNIINWWQDRRHVRPIETAVRFHTSSHSLYCPLPPSHPRHTPPPPPYLSNSHVHFFYLIYNDAFQTAAPKVFFLNQWGYTQIHWCRHTHQYSLFWLKPLGWVNISIIYHSSPTTYRGRPAEGLREFSPQ